MIKIKEDAPRRPVTKRVTKPVADVTKPATKRNKGGRPKTHASHADRQRAYRQRKTAAPAERTQPKGDYLV